MTLPASHVHVSEREGAHRWPDGRWDDSRWEDCAWAVAIEWLRLTYDPTIPATHPEAELLRAASGEPPTGGSNTGDVIRGIRNRYKLTVGPALSDSTMLAQLKTPGTAVIAGGKLGNFPAGHRLRRWDPPFTGGHSVLLVRLDDGTLWWCDPLAPTGTYKGEKVTEAEAKTFITGFAGSHLARPLLLSEMFPEVKYYPFPEGTRKFHVKAGTTVRGFDPAQPGKVVKQLAFDKDSSADCDAKVYVEWQQVPQGGSAPVPRGGPFYNVTTGFYAGLLVPGNEVTVADPPAPPEPDCDEKVAHAFDEGRRAEWDEWAKSFPPRP